MEMKDTVDARMSFVLAVRLQLKGLAMYHIVKVMYDNEMLLCRRDRREAREAKRAGNESTKLDELIWDDIEHENHFIWGEEKVIYIAYKARQVFVQSIKAFEESCHPVGEGGNLLDFQIFIALLARELGILLWCAWSNDPSRKLAWLKEEEDRQTEQLLNETIHRLREVPAIFIDLQNSN